MFGPTKPLYQIQRKLTYQRHVQRLNQINRQRPRKSKEDASLKQMHRIRHKSFQFHTVEHQNSINERNEKIIGNILRIASRKSQSISQPSMHYYNNRNRKRQQRQITRNNHILADRILTKHSQFDPATLKKNINSYEQMKRRMESNKRVSLPQLQKIPRVNSVEKSRRSKMLFKDFEEMY